MRFNRWVILSIGLIVVFVSLSACSGQTAASREQGSAGKVLAKIDQPLIGMPICGY
jgi:hypothetical protein